MKPRIGTLALLFASLAVTLVAAEMFLRVFYPAPYYGFDGTAPQRSLFQYDSLVGWRGRAGATSRFAALDFDVQVTQDAAGFRNSTPPYIPGQRNILVLGDSYGWGWGVEDDEVSAARISSSGNRVNAYNLAVPGYGTDQQLLALRRFLERAGADHYDGVFLLFYHNDFLDVLDTARFDYPKPRFVLDEFDELQIEHLPTTEPAASRYGQGDLPYERVAARSFMESSHLYNLTRHRWHRLMAARNAGSVGGMAAAYDLRLTLALLEAIQAESDRYGMYFHVVLLEMMGTSATSAQRLDDLATGLGAAGVEYSQFHRQTLPSTALWLDGHLSAYGQDRLARHILGVMGSRDSSP